MTDPKAAAGWYDDPSMVNTRRYWDGEQWTDQRIEAPPPVQSQWQPPQPQPATGGSASRIGKTILKVAGGILLVGFLPILVLNSIPNDTARSVGNGIWTLVLVLSVSVGLVGLVFVLVGVASGGSKSKSPPTA